MDTKSTIVQVPAAIIFRDDKLFIANANQRIKWPGCGNFPAAR
jgi:hypothetical protein